MNNRLDNSPTIMGILNITPDSFYKQSRSLNLDSIKVVGKENRGDSE